MVDDGLMDDELHLCDDSDDDEDDEDDEEDILSGFDDEDEEDDLFILEQVISGLDAYELKTCLSVVKKYRKNYGFFYDKLLAEKELRTS